ncbi:uncharacterized protein E0L32_007345 [Thyridium curvatum]|uniref:Uncharacterized protein n=1 Tax=Thyridium curvatum TaxID=1093900 RepID=A0A507AWJ8_9PEZI|nr:uncharacterized protein E0L32_007345 [Thyridium curvatum]TPX11847.1 hypothetical protein E0L32_007345 [Thyridium curvatum]
MADNGTTVSMMYGETPLKPNHTFSAPQGSSMEQNQAQQRLSYGLDRFLAESPADGNIFAAMMFGGTASAPSTSSGTSA